LHLIILTNSQNHIHTYVGKPLNTGPHSAIAPPKWYPVSVQLHCWQCCIHV